MGPYQVTQDQIDRSSTLTKKDLNRWYVMVQGSVQFVRCQEDGKALVQQLKDDLRAIA